jgi:transposase-like protein
MAQYKHYSKDFKLQAARLVTEQGYSLKDATQNYSYVRMALALKPIKQ